MTNDDTTKKAVLSLLKRGLATQSEAAALAGRSRQIVRHWVKDMPDARGAYLAKQWQMALKRSQKS